jgi:hypothetical protein
MQQRGALDNVPHDSSPVTLKRTCYRRSGEAWILFRVPGRLLWTLNTPLSVKMLRLSVWKERSSVDVVANRIRRGRSSGNRCDVWMLLIVMKYFENLGWDSTNSREISSQLLHTSRSAAVIMAYSLSGVRTDRGRPAITCAVSVTFPVSQRCCSSLRNTLLFGWRPG